MLAAGLKGVEEEYPLPPAVEGNGCSMANEERVARDIKILPGSMGEALALAEESTLLREALGEHLITSFIRNKKIINYEVEEMWGLGTPEDLQHYLVNHPKS